MSKVALVTGGTGDIGSTICEQLFDDGYTVIANCHPDDLTRSEGVVRNLIVAAKVVELVAFDVTDHETSKTAIDRILEKHTKIDVLVNAAGITRDALLSKLTPEHWNAVIRTNLDGVYNVTRNCIDGMIQQGYGRIVNISSVNGERGQIGQTNYSAAKAGMRGFTMALAREVARKGITVNCISPGYIQSTLLMGVPEHVREKIVEQIPAGRFGEPEEIARAVSFLAHEHGGYITGTNLSVNGGYHMG